MSLPVPLDVTVGNRRVTRQVKALSFRKEAIGGVRSIAFDLSRPLTDLNGLDPLSKVYVHDGRNGTCIAQARLGDTGRTASTDTGEQWSPVAFGPAQHPSEIRRPLVYVDKSLDGWRLTAVDNATAAGVNFDGSTFPGATGGTQGLLASWQDGTAVVTNSLVASRYDRAMQAGMKLAYVTYNWGAGVTAPGWIIDAVYSNDGNWGLSNTGTADSFNTAGGSRAAIVVANFANGRNVVDLRTFWSGGAATVTGAVTWAFIIPVVEMLRLDKTGAEITAGYGGQAVPHKIVEDLLGRVLPEFDGTNATVSQGSSFAITHLVYPDGTTAAQVLEDMMTFAPAYRWYTKPARNIDGKYQFSWDLWPTTVRYEATLDDGGSFPLSTQGVFNQVWVSWRDEVGRTRTTLRTKACKVLDTQGLTRTETIALGSEAGTLAQAEAAGDAFLNSHNVPKNGGTLTIARPIRDLITGALVMPWEIEAGELVRVRGVEAYPDAFNASTNDGVGIFRIFAVDYQSEGNVATLALDSDPKETEDALVLLLNDRKKGGLRR
ncbi:hypothetical protein [Nocardioides sp.]|uniref:hypothetical protein n=1 Tax=Nocardioides sp. TaxID=35761 RepID=UPI0035B442A2